MKGYFSTLINKSMPSENIKLMKTLRKELKRSFGGSKSNIQIKEHNTFIFLTVNEFPKQVSSKRLEQSQNQLYRRLQTYYAKSKSKLEKDLQSNRELKETSQIVKDFLKEIDPKLQKIFDLQLKKQISNLPTILYNLQIKSPTSIRNLSEEQKLHIYLSGIPHQIFTISPIPQDMVLENLVDKIAFLNFFYIFLEPTLIRLEEMNKVLERLELGLKGTHYKTSDPETQSKLEMFLRILSAKLSSLQNMDKMTLSILKLFKVPKAFFDRVDFTEHNNNLRISLNEVTYRIDQTENILMEVQEKLEKCLTNLKGYLDETTNVVKTVNSKDEFKLTQLSMAELSSDLFIEAELLKLWLDFFSSDIPFFTFQSNSSSFQPAIPSDTTADFIISVRGLIKNYNLGQTTVYALRGVDLDVKDGEFLAILGNSGAGKTTLLNCIAGLDQPDYGAVFFKGKDLHHLSDPEKSKSRLLEMGFIFQNYALLPHFDTRENVALPADLAGLSKDLKNRIEELLDGVGISKQAKQFPSQLSGGQLQRVAIARALTNRPKILFADEPTGDLDSQTGKQVMELIKRFHEETKTTIIIITHEQEIANYAQKQLNMEDGVIINK